MTRPVVVRPTNQSKTWMAELEETRKVMQERRVTVRTQ